MLLSDFLATAQWWFILFILGIGFLPIISLVCDKFFDKGYIFAKVFGIVTTAYCIFVLSLIHVLPFTALSSYLVFLLLVGIFFACIPKRKELLRELWKKKYLFLVEEIIFFLALVFWAIIRAFSPDIHGLEKFMDYGFLNSILRTTYFPPKDMWFTPLSINYYYFGHLATGVLTKMSGLPSALTFNLMLATVFACCFTESFSIGANLLHLRYLPTHVSFLKRFLAGILTAALVTFAGNLHVIYGFFKPYQVDHPLPPWALALSPTTYPNDYWYPNATRYIYHTIHEFPIYSWVVSDLHGHVLDIPFVLLVLGILLSLFYRSETETYHGKLSMFAHAVLSPKYLLLLGFLLAVLYMTNAWDGAIYLFLSVCFFATIAWQKKSTYSQWGKAMLISGVITLLTFILFSLPYNLTFKPFANGIGVICAPQFLTKIGHLGPFLFEADRCEHSYWWELLMLYGFFYFFSLVCIFTLYWTKKITRTDIFALVIILFSSWLIILPEFVYIKDIYPTYFRANTMFKLVFQAFILLSITSGYTIMRILLSTEKKLLSFRLLIFFPITIVLLILVFSYPFFAINSYYGNLKTYHGLNGVTYLHDLYPDDFAAIQWLNNTVSGQPVILEAQGDSYTDYARVAANTGLPTVLGWTVHEWLWRGSYDIPSPRITEVQTLYQSTDLTETKKLLKKYHVSYVFFGSLERQKYMNPDEAKFSLLGTVAYQHGATKIYKINPL